MFLSASHSDGSTLATPAMNTNSVGTATNSMYVNGNIKIGLYVYADTGAHANHIMTLQISMDGTNWQDTALTVTGVGFIEGTTVSEYIRAKVTTAESAASTCDVHISSK